MLHSPIHIQTSHSHSAAHSLRFIFSKEEKHFEFKINMFLCFMHSTLPLSQKTMISIHGSYYSS
jgi:hypothetical protein